MKEYRIGNSILTIIKKNGQFDCYCQSVWFMSLPAKNFREAYKIASNYI